MDSSVTPTYDCQKLFCSIVKEVEIPNLKSHGELMEKFWQMRIEKFEDVDTYYQRLKEMIDRLESINENCDEDIRFSIDAFSVRYKLFQAAESRPVFREFVKSITMKEPRQWSKISVKDFLKGLRLAETNDKIEKSNLSESMPQEVTAYKAIDRKEDSRGKSTELCWNFENGKLS